MRWTKHLLGSVVVYLVVAACGSGGGSGGASGGTAGGGGGEGGVGAGHDGAPGGPDEGGLLDAITNPEHDAIAAPGATVVDEQCDKTFVANTQTQVYAEHAFPGKTKNDLAGVQAVVHYHPGVFSPPPGYADQVWGVLVKDGAVAVQCGAQSSPSLDGVTFILPP